MIELDLVKFKQGIYRSIYMYVIRDHRTVFAPVRLVRRFQKNELFALFAQYELFALFVIWEKIVVRCSHRLFADRWSLGESLNEDDLVDDELKSIASSFSYLTSSINGDSQMLIMLWQTSFDRFDNNNHLNTCLWILYMYDVTTCRDPRTKTGWSRTF